MHFKVLKNGAIKTNGTNFLDEPLKTSSSVNNMKHKMKEYYFPKLKKNKS